MRVAFVSSSLSQHNYKFFQQLIARGCEVHWIIPDEPVDEMVRWSDFRALSGLVLHDYDGRGCRSGNAPTGTARMVFSSRAVQMWNKLRFVKGVLARVVPDVLQGNFVQDDGFYAAASDFHPFLEAVWGSDVLVNSVESRVSRWMLQYTIRKADAVYCDCQVVRDEILRHCRSAVCKPIHVFPQLGIDTALFSPGVSEASMAIRRRWEGKKLLLMTRWMAPVYGIEVMLQAMHRLLQVRSDLHAILIGSGPNREEYEALARKLGLSEKVTFMGDVENVQLPAWIQAADVYVSSSYSDGTSLSLLEAMACGRPVVVSDVPALLEWIVDGNNGRIFPRGNDRVLADVLLDLLNREEGAKRWGEINCQIARERADIHRNADRLLSIYRELVTVGVSCDGQAQQSVFSVESTQGCVHK